MSMAMVSLILAALVLPLATVAAAITTRRNCSDTCDGYEIPYPFGLGPSCSLPGFSLTCAGNRTLLGNSTVVDFFSVATDQPLVLLNSFSHSVKMIPGVRDYYVHWETPARPFAIATSLNPGLFIVGCSFIASLFIGNSSVEVGNCSVVCAEAQVMEKLPVGPCNGIGCCFINIQVNLRAFTLKISRISDSARSNKVYAFISGYEYQQFRPIDALRPILPSQRDSYFALEWAIPYQPNCSKRAMEEASYACVANGSKCQDSHIGGYVCYCQWGGGNPYVHGGCPEYHPPPQPLPLPRPEVDGFVQPRTGCPTACGNVSVPFPFGTEIGCFASVQLYLACMPALPGTVLPFLELTDRLVVSDISIEDGILHVQEKSEPEDLLSGSGSEPLFYALSGKWGVVKWVVDTMTCEEAKLSKSDYLCISSRSDCVDVTNVGYRCKCSSGFEGNPYLKDGCTDTNECLQPDKYICNGICHNRFGSYTCTSTVILDFPGFSGWISVR